MNILLLEDDANQIEPLVEELDDWFPGSHVEVVKTEVEFYHALEFTTPATYDAFIIDVMVPWTSPSEKKPMPDRVRAEGFNRAGIRCLEAIERRSDLDDVPVIVYSILDEDDIGDRVRDLRREYHSIPKQLDFTELLRYLDQINRRRSV